MVIVEVMILFYTLMTCNNSVENQIDCAASKIHGVAWKIHSVNIKIDCV
jgi:hypothetical protein